MTAGSRTLFTTWPFPGHLFPQIAIAHALQRRGHECAFYTGTQAARIVTEEGFRCYPFERLDERAVDELMRHRPADPWRLRRIPRMGLLFKRWLLDTIPQQIDDLERVLADWGPSVVASDPTLLAPILVPGEKHCVPVAVSSFVPACTVPGPDAPPFGPGLPRPRNWLARLRVNGARLLHRLSSGIGQRQINAIRLSHGLAPLSTSAAEHAGRMPLYLVPSAPEFDYDRHDLPPSVHYVGPCIWNRPQSEAATPWVTELDRRLPSVHVTEGTVHIQRPFLLEAAIKGLGHLPLQVIATTGGNRSIEELNLGAIPANVRIERWISHSDLLPHIDVMVTTGGAGSVLASLAAGVPLVIVPTEWDKPEIAQRVVEAGAGVRLAPARCTPAALRDSVLRVLGESAFREAARRMADIFARQGGPERAADLIVALSRRHMDAAVGS